MRLKSSPVATAVHRTQALIEHCELHFIDGCFHYTNSKPIQVRFLMLFHTAVFLCFPLVPCCSLGFLFIFIIIYYIDFDFISHARI